MVTLKYKSKLINLEELCDFTRPGTRINTLINIAAMRLGLHKYSKELCIKYSDSLCMINIYDDVSKVIAHSEEKDSLCLELTDKKELIVRNLEEKFIPINVYSYLLGKDFVYGLLMLGVGFENNDYYDSNTSWIYRAHPKIKDDIIGMRTLHQRCIECKTVNNYAWVIADINVDICLSLCDILYKKTDKQSFLTTIYSKNFKYWFDKKDNETKAHVSHLFSNHAYLHKGRWKIERRSDMISKKFLPKESVNLFVKNYFKYSTIEYIESAIRQLYIYSQFYYLYKFNITREILETFLEKENYPFPRNIFKMVVKGDITVNNYKYLHSLLDYCNYNEFLNITKLPDFNFIETESDYSRIFNIFFNRYALKTPKSYQKLYRVMQRIKEDSGYQETKENNEYILKEIIINARKSWHLRVAFKFFGDIGLYLNIRDECASTFMKKRDIIKELRYIGVSQGISQRFIDSKFTLNHKTLLEHYKKRIVNAKDIVYFQKSDTICQKRYRHTYVESFEFFPYYNKVYNDEIVEKILIKKETNSHDETLELTTEQDPFKITEEFIENLEIDDEVNFFISRTF